MREISTVKIGRRIGGGGQKASLPRVDRAILVKNWTLAGFSPGVIEASLNVGLVKALTGGGSQ